MKKKNKLPTGLIVGIIMGILAFILVSQFLKRLEPITVDYYVAKKDLYPGDIITDVDEYFTIESIPEYVPMHNAIAVDSEFEKEVDGTTKTVSAKDYLTGLEVYFPIFQGDDDIYNKLTVNVPNNLKNLSDDLPTDRRLLPIETNVIQSFGGRLKEGDRVDITFTYELEEEDILGNKSNRTVSVTALQGIRIHKVIYEPGVQEQVASGEIIAPNGYALLMTPEQVEAFNYFSQEGSYSITLNSSDPVRYETDGFDLNHIQSGKYKELFFNIEETNRNNDEE